jgi:thioredoxin-like negative regulator of GroEL
MLKRSEWLFLSLALLLVAGCAADRPVVRVDDVAGARELLEVEREVVRASGSLSPAERAIRMIELGLWSEAERIVTAGRFDPALALVEVRLRMKEQEFHEAEARLAEVLEADPSHREARLLKAELEVQAWELEAAAATALALLEERRRDEDAALLLGRIRLLEKNYDEALDWALQVQRWNRNNAGAHRLEADVRFWAQDPEGAEPALVRALELEPFDADARFNYGYAIWRRVDATQLDAMAAQWGLALELDPLHYYTHWHWGNGHTNLTYADYAHPTDSIVRERLLPVRDLVARGDLEAALRATRELDREFPESVLPAMLRGSAFYMAYEMEAGARLDSAQTTFAEILARKKNYGPAHNGMAAIIKQRQFLYLSSYDSLEAVIASVPLPRDRHFDEIFQDLAQYPGQRVKQMVRFQLGPAIAYVPMIHRQGAVFTIPPLHVDLAEAMNSPRLRTSTTFDNRQWMDIRGVGSGSTGLEYVERGAHWERNVTAHEYAHLFHGRILTDAENRRIRDLYHRAMEEGRTLDYYASNNESEYFAQVYEAYISPVKSHPLNHKAINTRADLERKDPAGFAFVDSLVKRIEAYLAGDAGAVRSNWAQVYTRLSEQARGGGQGRGAMSAGPSRPSATAFRAAAALLDSALARDPGYLPAQLSYAALHRSAGNYDEAERWLARAEGEDAGYAPIYTARAELVRARAVARDQDRGPEGEISLAEEAALYRRALELEDDLSSRARINQALRTRFAESGKIADAIRVAEEYVESAPTISTYLRDRRDDAAAYAQALRSEVGYAEAALPFFERLVGQKPQNYELRKQHATALTYAGRFQEAVDLLEEAQRILRAGGNPRADYMVQTAEIELLRGDSAAARAALEPILAGDARMNAADPQLLRVHAALGESRRVADGVSRLAAGDTRVASAEAAYTRGWIAELVGEIVGAEAHYRKAIRENPYHRSARVRLVRLLEGAGRDAAAGEVAAEVLSLSLPAGPDLRAELGLEVAE